jgi:hypothetical protein
MRAGVDSRREKTGRNPEAEGSSSSLALTPRYTRQPPMPLCPQTRLGHDEIISALGAGGTGEVYRATDTRLRCDHGAEVSSCVASFPYSSAA